MRGLALLGANPPQPSTLQRVFAVLAVLALYALHAPASLASLTQSRAVAVFTALLLAANHTFLSQALIAEVHTLHALLLLALLLALESLTGGDASGSAVTRPLTGVALIAGLSLAHHAMTLLAAPAVLLYLWTTRYPWRKITGRGWLTLAAAFTLPLLLYAYIPLRAGPQASPWLHQRLGETTLCSTTTIGPVHQLHHRPLDLRRLLMASSKRWATSPASPACGMPTSAGPA